MATSSRRFYRHLAGASFQTASASSFPSVVLTPGFPTTPLSLFIHPKSLNYGVKCALKAHTNYALVNLRCLLWGIWKNILMWC